MRRPAAVAVMALGLVAAAAWFFGRPLARKVTDDQVALYLEEHEPSLESTILTALAAPGDPSASPVLVPARASLGDVFRAEIDIDMFELAEAEGGYGGIKMSGEALPQCQFRVEPSYERGGTAFNCVNPRFFDCTDEGPEGIRAFDLRNAL